jgi:glycosyltransferase involved in cell wall biosynthesis
MGISGVSFCACSDGAGSDEVFGVGASLQEVKATPSSRIFSMYKPGRITIFLNKYTAQMLYRRLLEAMAYGLPIVASDIPGSGVPWVNQHDLSGFNVPVGSAKALADACNQILASEELRSRLSQGARQRFLAEFTEEVSVKRMMLTYERLLED